MARRFISPKLADVTQDIAGPIPIDLIRRWASATKSPQSHQNLLSDYRVHGITVVSDSSGLSKLSKERSLLEVMRLIHKPKEVIYSYGKIPGGRAIGIWAADNTQMFYDSTISSEEIISQMISAQRTLAGFPMKVGLAIHSGEFLEIGGGLHGKEADMVEAIGESHTEGGEITITDEVAEMIPNSLKKLLKPNNNSEVASHTYDLAYERAAIVNGGRLSGRYPCPFPQDFYDLLARYDGKELAPKEYTKYRKNSVVILVKIHHPKRIYLLDTLADWVLANSVIDEVVEGERVQIIKSNGNLAIFVTNNPKDAIDFTRKLYEVLYKNTYQVTIGVAIGEVLVFPLEQGGYDIAGGPVNIASKLAEDSGFSSGVLIEESVIKKHNNVSNSERFQIALSGVKISGIRFVQ